MAPPNFEGSPRQVFGAMLRYYRAKAGVSQEQLGARIYLSGDMIGKVENGQRTLSEDHTAACDEELTTGGALTELRERLRDYLRQQVYPGWFHRWPEAEAEARALRSYQPLLVPGQIQTEGYARAVLRGAQPDAADERIEEQVSARMQRQEIFAKDTPPHLWCVLDEGVVHRCIGDRKVMHEQLLHLAEVVDRPKMSVQVIPFDVGARTGLLGGFAIADLGGPNDTLYLETATTGQVVEVPSVVSQASIIFDTLRSEALPRGASRDLIVKVAEEKWT